MKARLGALALVALLAACGSRTELRPEEGMRSVPKAADATRAEKPSELMAASTQARPDRKADLLTKSEERQDDPFDIPPGPRNGTPGAKGPASIPPPDAPAKPKPKPALDAPPRPASPQTPEAGS